MKPRRSQRETQWLGGKEPAWNLLTYASWCALQRLPDDGESALSLSDGAASSLASNALTFLTHVDSGAKLTDKGNLSRAFVAEMLGRFVWPDFFDTDPYCRRDKVLNEPDFPPLHIVRIFCDRAKLVRIRDRRMHLTKKGEALIAEADAGKLNRLLFLAAFWDTNFAYFDGFPLAPWPQGQIGVILWSLSIAADGWQKPDDLVRLCATPVIGILEAEQNEAGDIFDARILRILSWFGLLEVESTPDAKWAFIKRRRYRKSRLFDLFFRFDVTLEGLDMPVQ